MRPHLLARPLACVAVGLFLLAPQAGAAAPEFIVSGGDLERPVYVSVRDLEGVPGGAPGGGGGGPVPERLGPRYDLDVLRASPLAPGDTRVSRLLEGRWGYYPDAGGAIDDRGAWVPFPPALRRVIAGRMAEAALAGPRFGMPVVAGLVGAAFGTGLVVRDRWSSRRRRTASVTALSRGVRAAGPPTGHHRSGARPPTPRPERLVVGNVIALRSGRPPAGTCQHRHPEGQRAD